MSSGFETFEQAVANFWLWQYGQSSFNPSFAVMLIDLYRKADTGNKRALASLWPNLAIVNSAWEEAGDNGNDLFREHSMPIPGDHNTSPSSTGKE